MGLDLVRATGGRIRGLLRAPLMIGDQQAELAAEADWVSDSHFDIDMRLTPLRPAGIGQLPASADFLASLDMPIALAASARFDANFVPKQFQADIRLGQGQLKVGQGAIPLRTGVIILSGTPDRITITKAHFDVAHAPYGSPEIVDIGATI